MKTICSLLTILLTFTGTINVFACSCQDELPVSASIKYADVVFSGQVISKTLTRNYDSLGIVVTGDTKKTGITGRELPLVAVKIKVEKMYKGQLVDSILTILTAPTGATCGVYFQTGQKCIVYATKFDQILGSLKIKRSSKDKTAFWTHLCTRTQGWNGEEEREIMKEMKS
jgi:hypothetical protein